MAAVHEGGAGASTYDYGDEQAPKRRRRSPGRGMRPASHVRHHRHPTPVQSRASTRSHVDSGRHYPVRQRELSSVWFAAILFSAVAVTTALLIGAAMLLA